MHRKTIIALLIFLAVILETSLLPNIFPFGIAPDVVLTMIIIWSSKSAFENLWVWALSAGLILDVMTFGPFGASAISFLVISFGIGSLSKRFFVTQKNRTFFVAAIFILGGTLMNYILTNFLFGAADYFSGQTYALSLQTIQLKNIFFKILNNLVIFSVIYWPIVKSENIFQIRESKLVFK